MKPKCGEGLVTMICSPVDFLITYPSNIFSWPPCRLPYTFTFSLGERSSFLLSGNFARTRTEPELSVKVKPFSSSWVTVPSIMLTGGNAKFLIGVVPAQPLVVRTTIVMRSKRRIPISSLRFVDMPKVRRIKKSLLLWLRRVLIAHFILIRDFAVTTRIIKIMLIQRFSYRFNDEFHTLRSGWRGTIRYQIVICDLILSSVHFHMWLCATASSRQWPSILRDIAGRLAFPIFE
jgi:hypothetical protein